MPGSGRLKECGPGSNSLAEGLTTLRGSSPAPSSSAPAPASRKPFGREGLSSAAPGHLEGRVQRRSVQTRLPAPITVSRPFAQKAHPSRAFSTSSLENGYRQALGNPERGASGVKSQGPGEAQPRAGTLSARGSALPGRLSPASRPGVGRRGELRSASGLRAPGVTAGRLGVRARRRVSGTPSSPHRGESASEGGGEDRRDPPPGPRAHPRPPRLRPAERGRV